MLPPFTHRLRRRSFLTAAIATAANATLLSAHKSVAQSADKTLRVGYQRYGTLIILKQSGLLEKALSPAGWSVKWSEFIAGPQMLQALSADAIDLAETGDAPPIFAQSNWPDRLVYIGHSGSAPLGEGILVQADSGIEAVKDLKGKKVAFNRGSNVHYLLLNALTQSGLTMQDVHPVNLTPAAARAAFETKHIDAWAIWDPYLAAGEALPSAKLLTSAENLSPNRQFLLSRRAFIDQNADVARKVVTTFSGLEPWVTQNQQDLIHTLAESTGLAEGVIKTALSRLSLDVGFMDTTTQAEQQKAADLLAQNALIPGTLRVEDMIWKG
ncbi:aliphatic sulfonate ABC transporter substrate-binding protein [Acetobacter tropicalis]|uniref:Putative aliphatic sulfonates-binding protein n=1 Tax=Acetobacter tropicalis TaxID=104102 RepID=A0A094YIA1_9PROT|nr:aliphatic sulfonate ABC transporter substrate-binding protein [Acetobacter tropicalis]KGB21072.1 Alkanesulfonates-binding protein [Acetobacter tropicalis]MBC9008715.1 aliphatic sulfonate ABC transporter substrate-binding protein [Acetobacter tropicalis]MDO8173000.1 aliphatic sulfonate ABC transporter substrate-binding protein [Acetobacter tropicalis]